MAERAIILIEGHARGNGLRYVQAAQRLGFHPITLSADPAQYEYLAAEEVETIRVDTNNLDALILECSRLRAIYELAGITGFVGDDESVYATVGKLCQHFDLPGPDPASIERCCDKFTQHQFLANAGVLVPAYRLVANATEVEGAAAEIGLPVIVKPAVGGGSIGVRLCRNVEELAAHTSELLGGERAWRSSPRILVEEFAQGPHYIAQTMGNDVIAIGAAEYGPPPHFVFRQLLYPAVLTDHQQELLAKVSLSCLRALGLGWGPANIEIRWTTSGPVVIEVNPRLAGAPDPQLVRLAYGVDLITEHIKLVTGYDCDLRKSHSHTAIAQALVPDSNGILEWIDGYHRATAISGVDEVNIFIGAKTSIIRKGDYRDRIGYVSAVSPCLAQTKTILKRAMDLISWSITPFPTSGEQD